MTTHDEAQIRELVDAWTRALRAKDVDAVMSHYTPDVIAFDLAPPLQHDAAACRRGLESWFPTWDGPIGYEVAELVISAGDPVAFCRGLSHLTGKRTDGSTTDVWARVTVCLRKVGGRWLVAHEHQSVPFYMDGSLKAAVDLKP